ncbi:hypothetical protein AMS68_005603 [Peltaster fructicola]|uniref:NTF2-like domain-containing protein n=1 Tax=Peltaster fructicola TaxID=286661 RepID=A0A6H0XZH7_9PEZI|nr:hypothetical protein AMS68_005603 [Peltaster fructicola]
MPSFNKLVFYLSAATTALAIPSLLHNRAETCLDSNAANTIVDQWKSILYKDDKTQPSDVLATDYKEYSPSFWALNNYCVQTDGLTSELPWSRAVFNSSSDYQKTYDSSSRARWTWIDGAKAVDCTRIGLTGYIALSADGTKIPAVAFMETKSDGSSFKISTLHWEFDDTQAQVVLKDNSQCKGRSANGKFGIIA